MSESERDLARWMDEIRSEREKATEMSETTIQQVPGSPLTEVPAPELTATATADGRVVVTPKPRKRGAARTKPVTKPAPVVTPDAAKAKDASVLNGVSKPATPKPAKKAPARKTETVELPKAADLGQANDSQATVTANGNSKRTANQELAKRLADAAAREFAKDDTASQEKVANWLKSLPTGGEGAGPLRYWPEGFARPTSADWKR